MIELLAVVAILAIMTAVAAPAFNEFIANQRVKNASFNLYSAITYARSEAIKRSCPVVITPTSSVNWALGWSIATGASCAAAATLRSQGNQGSFSIVTDSALSSITYRPDGRTSSAQTTFTLTSSNGPQGRCIRIDASGSPAVKALPTGGTC